MQFKQSPNRSIHNEACVYRKNVLLCCSCCCFSIYISSAGCCVPFFDFIFISFRSDFLACVTCRTQIGQSGSERATIGHNHFATSLFIILLFVATVFHFYGSGSNNNNNVLCTQGFHQRYYWKKMKSIMSSFHALIEFYSHARESMHCMVYFYREKKSDRVRDS